MTGIETRRPATLADYLALPDDTRAELLVGELLVNPAPHFDHQTVVGNLYLALRAHVDETDRGRAWIAPVDIHLPTGDVVQPDVVFIAKESLHICKGTHAEGAPEFLIEVLSPANPARDRIVKRERYARSGVREFWIVDPITRTVAVLHLEGDRYADPRVHREGHVITSRVLPELSMPVADVFRGISG